MKLTNDERLRAAGDGKFVGLRLGMGLLVLGLGLVTGQLAGAQAVSTTTVQGTVYLANGQIGAGVVELSWPSFTTANGQKVAAGKLWVTIGADGFLSVNLAANVGASPAGLFYTAVYQMSDGTTSTEYWVVPAAAQATLGQVQSQLMPAAQAVQAVSKSYVDLAISELTQSLLTASGGTLGGPLYLSGDPTQPLQAADKHYVDTEFSEALPLSGGTETGAVYLNADPTTATQAADKHYVDTQVATALPLTGGAASGELTARQLGAVYQADQFAGADFGAKVQACVNGLSTTYGGTCDARNFSGTLGMGSSLTISTANATVLLPCATIATANQLVVTAGTRNVTLRGCALRGASTASGSQGGTVFLYSGSGAMVQVGDPTYAADTPGFHLDDVVINTTASASATAMALVAYRTQEMDLSGLYLLGNGNQTGMTLDGTGNYTGGSFAGIQIDGFQTAVNAIGHQVANAATTDWVNASTFTRMHIDCPTSGGSPITGTVGINLAQGDGNTLTGGDVESCATALHLGANAQNNTIVGLRNENSTNQVVADAGSQYNNWMTGGTMFTGQLTDNGTRNSFLDTFHRSFNGMNGDWYGSQQDATVTNHYRVGTGAGNERGLLNRYQTDYGYRWTMGLSDATAGEQFYQVLDELNSVYRISVGQYNHGQASTNNQTVINAAGTGAVVLNGSNNAGTGGVVIGSGGATETTVATVSNAGNAQFNGTLQVGGASTFTGSTTVKNGADAEVDAFLWAGATASQKESLIYKDWNGNSQWYAEKDASNNWELNSAVGGLDSFKAYQSTNSGDTYVNASNGSGVVRVNYESGSGTQFKVYGGSSSTLYASFTGATSIQFPGLAASSGHFCLQVDNSGYVSNTGSACGTGSGGAGSGVVNTGTTGQIAFYTTNGSTVGGETTVPLASGGTGATSAAGALASLGALAANGVTTSSLDGGSMAIPGQLTVGTGLPANAPSGTLGASVVYAANDVANVIAYGADPSGTIDSTAAIQAAINAKSKVYFPPGTFVVSTSLNLTNNPYGWKLFGSSTLTSTIFWKGPASQSVIDMSGSQGISMQDMLISTGPTYTAQAGILMSRIGGSGSNEHELLRVNVIGYFTVAALYTLQSESDDFIDCEFWNHNTTGSYNYAVVRTAGVTGTPYNTPEFGVSSIYQTMQASGGNTVGFFLGDYFLSDVGTAFYCNGCYDMSMHGGYVNGGVNTTALAGIELKNSNKILLSGLREEGNESDGLYILGGVDGLIVDGTTLAGVNSSTSASVYMGDTSTAAHVHLRGSCKGSTVPCAVFYNLTQSEVDLGGNGALVKGNATQNRVVNGYDQSGSNNSWTVNGTDTGTLMDTGVVGSGSMLGYTGNFYSNSVVVGRPYYQGTVPGQVYVYNAGALVQEFVQSGSASTGALACYDAAVNSFNTPHAQFCGAIEGTSNGAGDAVMYSQDATGAAKESLRLRGQYNQIVQGLTLPVASGVYQGGGTMTGTSGQTCTLTGFNAAGSGATATVALTGSNTIATGTALTLTAEGNGFQSAPTTATLGSGTATCSGTALVQTALDMGYFPHSDIGFVLKTNAQLQSATASCDASHMGMIQYTSQGSGYADTMQVCLKTASNTYAFQSVGNAAGTAGGDLSGSYPNPLVAKVNGGSLPASKTIVGTNGSGQLVDATTATLGNNTTGNAATATALAATPSQCSAGSYSTGITVGGAANCAQVTYAQVGGTTPTWNQSTTGSAATAANFTGSLGGDVTGTQGATSVVKVNGGSVPTSAALLGSNSSGQLVSVATPPAVIVVSTHGDLVCAHAGDTTIGAVSITGVSSTASTMTYTLSSAPNYFNTGQIVSSQGNTTSGYNAAPLTVSAVSGLTVTVSSSANPGAGTGGGTLSLYCANTTTDAGGQSVPWSTTYTVPANTLGVTLNSFTLTGQFTSWTSSTPPYIEASMLYGGTAVFPVGSGFAVPASLSNRPAALPFMGTMLNTTTMATSALPGSVGNNAGTFNATAGGSYQPSLNTTTGKALGLEVYFAATGVASGTYSSGGTISGSAGQTCTLSSFNSSASGATATVTLTGTNTIAGGTALAVTNTGQGATAAPTTATLGSGTATCSGTATIATVLGGAQGNAMLMNALVMHP